MRRGISIAVLAAIVCALLAPLAQGSASSVAACCRAGGTHHCMGMGGPEGFRTQASNCPYRVAPAVTPANPAIFTPSTSITARHASATVFPAVDIAPNAAVHGDVRKRGPPSA